MFPASMPRSCGDFGECMGTRFGLVSSMNGCLRFVIGVVAYTMMIRILRYGFKAKVPCLLTRDNTVRVYVRPRTDPITN